jgi:hypothetical protein
MDYGIIPKIVENFIVGRNSDTITMLVTYDYFIIKRHRRPCVWVVSCGFIDPNNHFRPDCIRCPLNVISQPISFDDACNYIQDIMSLKEL